MIIVSLKAAIYASGSMDELSVETSTKVNFSSLPFEFLTEILLLTSYVMSQKHDLTTGKCFNLLIQINGVVTPKKDALPI